MLWLTIALVWAAEPGPDAEITVYGDPLSPWQDTRWWVASETIDADAPLTLGLDGRSFRCPAWQVEAMLHCRVTKPKRKGGWVQCEIERASVRVVTYDAWQRPRDRRHVERALAEIAAQLARTAVRLRIHGAGTVTIAKEQPDRTALGALLLDQAISAFHLEVPETGWQDGARWFTYEEPLLAANLELGTYGFERAVHNANLYQGRRLVQTLAAANRTVVVGMLDGLGRLHGRMPRDELTGRMRVEANRFLPGGSPRDPPGGGGAFQEFVESGKLRLHAVADYDMALGGIRERVWTVQGQGAASLLRSGRLRRLGTDEVVDLGRTTQVSPPREPRLDLPHWTPLPDGVRQPGEGSAVVR